MPLTIDNESRLRSKLSIDVDYSCDRYKTKNLIYTFPSPVLEAVDKNIYYLLRNSRQTHLDRKYYYRPDYLSYDEYGTVVLAHLLMYINGVSCLENFKMPTVVLPNYSAIMDIVHDKFPDRHVEELFEVEW